MTAPKKIIDVLKQVIIGKDDVIKLTLAAFLAGGHVLLEDSPGVGKTTLALAMSKALGVDFGRIQLTPDTVASDITGFTAYDPKTGGFVFHQGAAMTNLLLADELNRTSGKTQSALLEIMEEGKTTVDGKTIPLPKPFNVIATQNPVGTAGTSEIPLSQLDRFMIRVHMGAPDRESLKNILMDRHHSDPLDKAEQVCTAEELIAMQKECENIFVSEKIYYYVCDICEKVSQNEHTEIGISPRGALALCRMAKAVAYLDERDYVVPSDIRTCFIPVCAHRIQLTGSAGYSGITAEKLLENVISEVKAPETKALNDIGRGKN